MGCAAEPRSLSCFAQPFVVGFLAGSLARKTLLVRRMNPTSFTFARIIGVSALFKSGA